jgi:hypothetical protein
MPPEKHAKTKKSSKAIVQARVAEVLKMRLAGAEFHDIVQYASETDEATSRPWNVTERQLRNYVRDSDLLLARSLEEKVKPLFNLHRAQRRDLFRQALQTGDLRTALSVLKDEAELLGLYPGKLSTKEVVALATQLTTLALKRLPPEQQEAFAAEVAAVLSALESKQ